MSKPAFSNLRPVKATLQTSGYGGNKYQDFLIDESRSPFRLDLKDVLKSELKDLNKLVFISQVT